jgi:thiamine kinase-like enzyme
MHSYLPPDHAIPHLDDTLSFLEYQNINFDKIISYVDNGEKQIYEFIKNIYKEIYEEMIQIYQSSKNKLSLIRLVHGNLDTSTIITNSFKFKFINFENCFTGSPFFDLANLIFELQMDGLNEFDFVTKRMQDSKIVENRLKASKFIEEYKICKQIWTRKKFLDILKEYVKEVIILNCSRIGKMSKLAHEFSTHFYRFSEIDCFEQHKDIFVKKFSDLFLNE